MALPGVGFKVSLWAKLARGSSEGRLWGFLFSSALTHKVENAKNSAEKTEHSHGSHDYDYLWNLVECLKMPYIVFN
jgi:hypothetical protein